MVDDLDSDAARFGFGERSGYRATQAFPGFFVDLRLQRRFQGLIGVRRCAEEIGMPDEEALFVVVRVHKPASDSFCSVASDFARGGVKDIYADDLYVNLAVLRFQDLNVWLAENDEQVSLARVLQFIGHVQVGVHPCLQDWNLA